MPAAKASAKRRAIPRVSADDFAERSYFISGWRGRADQGDLLSHLSCATLLSYGCRGDPLPWGGSNMALVAPALLSADFARLSEALEMIKAAGASMVHVDVMDGHFAPDVTVGQPVIQSLRRATDLVLDLRLAIERPERYAGEFIAAGADRIAIHPESTWHLCRVLELIRARGAKAGIALNTATSIESVTEVLGDVDFVTILSAHLGGDDTFLPRAVDKISSCSRMRADRRLEFAIQAEGGIGFDNLEELIRAGADILVAGSVIFHNDDPRARLAEMIRLASELHQTSRV